MKLSAALARAALFAVLTVIGAWLALSRSADGPAVDDADLMIAPAAPPEHENAFLTLTSAAALLDMPADDAETERWRALASGEAWDDALAAYALARSERALAAFARAGRQTKLHSLVGAESSDAARDIAAWLDLSRLQAVRARSLAQSRRISESVAEALVSIRVARVVAADTNGSRLTALVANGVAEPGLSALRAALNAGALTAADAGTLLRQLATLRADPAAWRPALAAEYRRSIAPMPDRVDVFSGRPPSGLVDAAVQFFPQAYRYQPNNTRAAYAANIRAEQAMLSAACIQTSPQLDEPGVAERLEPNDLGRAFLALVESPPTTAHARCEYDTRIEALRGALAVQQFERARGGLPPSLEALVPDYLPEAPRDWFSDGALRLDRAAREIVSFGAWELRDTAPREERFALLPAPSAP